EDVWLSLDNTNSSCVVGGTQGGIRSFENVLKNNSIKSMRLKTSHAFHTPMMDEAAVEFSQCLKQYDMGEPTIPILLNGTGKWNEKGDLSNPDYWSDHILQTVRFADSLDHLLTDENAVFIEVGAGRSLISMIRQHQPVKDGQGLIHLLPHPKEKANDVEHICKMVGKAWEAGVSIDWHAFKGDVHQKRISLPTYAFDKAAFPLSFTGIDHNAPTQDIVTGDMQETPEQRHVIKDDDDLKQAIMDAYQSVFGFEDIEGDQDFFELGGDSL